MSKIGIIAGGGKLPILIGRNLIKSGKSVVFFCVEEYAKQNDYKKYTNNFIKLKSISNILKLFKVHQIKNIVMAGNIKRPSLKDLKFDLKTIKSLS